MEISDLEAQFVKNYERILAETSGKGRSDVEICIIFDESCEILDQY